MLPDRVFNPGPLTYESGALPIALRGPAIIRTTVGDNEKPCATERRSSQDPLKRGSNPGLLDQQANA